MYVLVCRFVVVGDVSEKLTCPTSLLRSFAPSLLESRASFPPSQPGGRRVTAQRSSTREDGLSHGCTCPGPSPTRICNRTGEMFASVLLGRFVVPEPHSTANMPISPLLDPLRSTQCKLADCIGNDHRAAPSTSQFEQLAAFQFRLYSSQSHTTTTSSRPKVDNLEIQPHKES